MANESVCVIFGGPSGEHLLSLRSAKSVLDQLTSSKFYLTALYVTKNFEWKYYCKDLSNINIESDNLEQIFCPLLPSEREAFLKSFDVIFPAIHGEWGESGELQQYLEEKGIPFVGSDYQASRLGMDKDLCKRTIHAQGIPVVPWICLDGDVDLSQVSGKIENSNLSYPLIVKPNDLGSSLGVFKVNNYSELETSILRIKKMKRSKILIENFIVNLKELECSVLHTDKIIVSPPGSFHHSHEFTDENVKFKMLASPAIPAIVEKRLQDKVIQYSKEIFIALNLSDCARVDFLYNQISKEIYFNEVNTLPSFRATSMYAKNLEFLGQSYCDILTSLISKYL